MDYEHIEDGIHRYYNRFRAYARGQQRYFTTIELAREWRDKERGKLKGRRYLHTTKRYDAIRQDLPVGIYERQCVRPRINGGHQDYRAIRGYIWLDGVLFAQIERAYGKKRTREEAIEMVVNERDRLEKEIMA